MANTTESLRKLASLMNEQLDKDYSKKGITFVAHTDVVVRTGSWYGMKIDGAGTDAQFTTLTVDGQDLSGLVLDAGDTLYGDITAVTSLAATTCNIILLKK